jgi:putative iron-regulated protein
MPKTPAQNTKKTSLSGLILIWVPVLLVACGGQEQFSALKSVNASEEKTLEILTEVNTSSDPETFAKDENSPAYLNVLLNPSSTNQFYKTESDVVHEFVNGIVTIIGEASGAKLPDATGETPQDANARLEESPFSWNSLNDFMFNVRSIYSVYTGVYRDSRGPGIKDIVARYNPTLANQIEEQIMNCMRLIQAIRPAGGGDFGQAIFTPDGRQRTMQAVQALNALQATLQEQVLPLVDR